MNWWIYKGKGQSHDNVDKLPESPPWRQFSEAAKRQRGIQFKPSEEEIELVNAALYLRRPLLVTGKPGTGKTTLGYAIAYELGLGDVLRWSITTRTTLQEGLYRYDAIARLQDTSLYTTRQQDPPDISQYLRLGPLGTAFAPTKRPRLLLIDEIDKSDIDLPNDLLHIFEEGEFEIPELVRLKQEQQIISIQPFDKGEAVPVKEGKIGCDVFPVVIMTSNGEREFPPAFLRRCLQLPMQLPDEDRLRSIVTAMLKPDATKQTQINDLIREFKKQRDTENKTLATDQLLNVVYLALKDIDPLARDRDELLKALWKSLTD